MLSRKDLLRTAFDEAVRVVSISWTEEKVARAAIENRLNEYARREGVTFSDHEICQAVEDGLDSLKKAGDDFKYQMKMMN